MKPILFLLSFLLLLHSSNSQESIFEPLFKNYSIRDGLPSSRVYQVKQDSKGFIWMATDNGISRFDGNEFVNYTKSDGLCVRTLFGIYEDVQERIWFYSFSGELIFYDYEDQQMHCPAFNAKLKELTNGKILNGLLINQDTIYTHDYSGTLYKICQSTNTISTQLNEDSYRFYFFDNGEFAYGYSGAVKDTNFLDLKLIDGSKSRVAITINDDFSYTLPSATYSSQEAAVYFVARQNLFLLDLNTQQILSHQLSDKNSQSLYKDSKENLWLGTFTDGVYAYRVLDDSLNIKKHLLKEYMVTSILEDKEGGYWFSTHNNGVFYSPNLGIEGLSDRAMEKFTSSSQILLLEEGENSVFLSNATGEVLKLDPKGQGSIKLIGKENRNFNGLFIINNEYLKPNDINSTIDHSSSPKSRIESYIEGESNAALISKGNYILVYSRTGNLFKKDYEVRKNSKFKNYLLTSNKDFYASDNTHLWFYDHSAASWLEFKDKEENNSIEVTSIEPFKGDTVLISTRNQGVLLIHKDSVVTNVNKDHHLNVDYCNRILYDDPFILLSTNEGLYRLRAPFSKNGPVESITRTRGLPSNEVYAVLRSDDILYISTSEGLCRLDTSIFSSPITPIESVIESIYLNDQLIDLDSNLSLSRKDIDLSIRYVSNSFVNTSNNSFRYRLKEDAEWTYTKDTELSFSNLGPAKYRFELQASHSDDGWGESAIFSFEILPSFWQTPFFLVLAIALSLILAYAIFRFRIAQLKRVSQLENELVKTQNRALSAQMNPHFIFNSLNSISHGILNQDKRTSVKYIGKFAKLMRAIFENSEETFITLNEELSALKNYIELEQLRLQGKLEYKINIEEEINKDQIFIPALILQPFAENAIWHGIAPLEKEKGILEISIAKKEDNLIIRILDNGVGIRKRDSNKQKSSTQTIKRRLKLIELIYKRKIHFAMNSRNGSKEESGTEIQLSLPIIITKP